MLSPPSVFGHRRSTSFFRLRPGRQRLARGEKSPKRRDPWSRDIVDGSGWVREGRRVFHVAPHRVVGTHKHLYKLAYGPRDIVISPSDIVRHGVSDFGKAV